MNVKKRITNYITNSIFCVFSLQCRFLLHLGPNFKYFPKVIRIIRKKYWKNNMYI